MLFTIGYEGRDVDDCCRVSNQPASRLSWMFGIGHSHESAGFRVEARSLVFQEYRHFLCRQREALDEARQLIATGTCCLRCYESDASTCHRHIVAEELSRTAGTTVQHL